MTTHLHKAAQAPATTPGHVAAKAVVNAARELGLSQRDLAQTLGLSEPSISRMKSGGFALDGKPLELALCLIRVFRSLDALAGGESAVIRGWMANPNHDLGGHPKALIAQATGLIDVMNYLDAARAPV
ncbi:XRE family transcriptional regulator [Pseudorhodobacter sp. E13]|uniref:XRE family transcriptional regulator n=1 Tax=Pseudorhodobacter sp. E13 TaxID=2487931 RepID=UPI000F8D55BC|nr:XRE family transcriptional regulator [Pseudorhodobacter sp. E13]RUS59171.1 XRE family transcriptional regulator [Pseudorhodobacter sp. E13]